MARMRTGLAALDADERASLDPRPPRVASWLLAMAIAFCGAACNGVSSENIALWKTTEKGPNRLHDALADTSVPPRLRAEAAMALIDIGRPGDVDAVLASLKPEDRAELAKSLEPAYEVAMKDPSPDRALAYRDALFSLRQLSLADEQKQIDVALLPAIEADLKSGKLRQGQHSIDKMLTAIGAGAGDMLVRVLADPDAPYLPAAELLAKVGGDDARDKGAAALVARVSRIEAAGKQHPGPFYRALGSLGGPTATKYLEPQVTGKDQDRAVLATRALAARRDPTVLPFALKVAGDAKADKAVRDEMFGVIETIGGLEAEKGLLVIISSDKEEIVRYRAFESALAVRSADGIVPALEAFPAGASYKKVDVDDLMVKLIEKIGPPARPALVRALSSHVPLARMTAVMALAQIGRAPDAPALDKLTDDTSPVKGFPAGDTVGKEAAAAAAAAKKRT
jgi:HEAT repeat protein